MVLYIHRSVRRLFESYSQGHKFIALCCPDTLCRVLSLHHVPSAGSPNIKFGLQQRIEAAQSEGSLPFRLPRNPVSGQAASAFSPYSVVKDRSGFPDPCLPLHYQPQRQTRKKQNPGRLSAPGSSLASVSFSYVYGKTEESEDPVSGRIASAPLIGFCSLPVVCHITLIVFSSVPSFPRNTDNILPNSEDVQQIFSDFFRRSQFTHPEVPVFRREKHIRGIGNPRAVSTTKRVMPHG